MSAPILATCALFLIPGVLFAQAASEDAPDPALRAQFDSAYYAWDAGRYPEALERLQRLLRMPGGDALLEPIALLTGELYHTVELTTDGRSPRWSGDGKFVAYETGTGPERLTRIVAYENGGLRQAAQLKGHGLVFSHDGRNAAYLVTPETPELRAARAELDRLTGGQERQAAQRRVEQLESETARIILRDLTTGRERTVDAPGITRGFLAFAGDGQLYVFGGASGSSSVDRVFRATGNAPGIALAPGSVPTPVASARALAGPRMIIAQGGRGGGFSVVDASSGNVRRFDGSSPGISADGRFVTFVGRAGQENTISLIDVTSSAEPTVVKRSTLGLASSAVSPDGRRIAFQVMPREDWELYVINADTTGEMRFTREIQHDLLPQFLSHDRILAVMGEARHRRSYVYELSRIPAGRAAPDTPMPAGGAGERFLSTGTDIPERIRLFHNNTVRTVAPEYEWVVSPDATKVLIVAERDGDTVSPERGVYLMDLTRRVTRDEVLQRIAASGESERRLREHGTRVFEPISPAVRDAVAQVATARVSGYAHDLYQFDSKYITQPGNLKAIDTSPRSSVPGATSPSCSGSRCAASAPPTSSRSCPAP